MPVVQSSVTSNSLRPHQCSTPSFPLLHHLLELAQTHVHQVGDAIQTSHPLSSPFFQPSIFPSIRVFSSESVLRIRWPIIGTSASASVLPVNSQDWFRLGWTGWISLQSKGLQESSPTPQFKSINYSALSFLYSPTLTTIPDYWKNQSLDQTDLCWQSNVSAFEYAT